MGALSGAFGLKSLLQPQFARNSTSSRIPRLPGTNVRRFSDSRSLISKNLGQSQNSREFLFPQPLCSASASWPYGSWETGPDEEDSNRPWIGFSEQEGGFEVLAMGLGVLVSVALVVSKQGALGVPLGVLSVAVLTASTIALRHQVFSLCAALVAHYNSVQAAMAVQLSSMRNNAKTWGTRNGASVHTPTVSTRDVQSAPVTASQGSVKGQEEYSKEESKGLSSTEIEATLLEISKSVAQLTMVVANLDNKISIMEKIEFNNASRLESLTLEVSQNLKTVKDATARVAQESLEKRPYVYQGGRTLSADFSGAKPRQNGAYRKNLVITGSGTQLKWEKAVVKDTSVNEVQSQVLEVQFARLMYALAVPGYDRPEASFASNRVDVFSAPGYDSKVKEDEVLFLEMKPVDITTEVESCKANFSQPAPLKFSKTQIGDTSMELLFQEVGITTPQEADDLVQSKQQNIAAVEAMELSFQDAGVRAPQEDSVTSSGGPVQSKQNIAAVHADATSVRNVVQDVGQLKTTLAPPVRSGVEDNTVVRDKSAQGRERIRNEVDARREVPSSRRFSRVAADRSSEHELEGSEAFRAVPTTTSHPDLSRLKRIMRGTEPSVAHAAEPVRRPQPNSWIQNDPMVSEVAQPKVMYREKPAMTSVLRATQSGAGWDDYEGVNDRAGVRSRGTTRSEGEEISPSSKPDYGQRWRREGPSDATDADFGGNGSSSDTNRGENGSKRRQSSSRGSRMDYDSDEDAEVEPRTPRDERPTPASPSYPSERTDTYRNLPEPKSPKDEGFQQIIDEVEALLKEGREGLEGRIEVDVAERMLYEAADLCAKAVEMRPSSLVAVGMWGNTLLLHGELKLRFSQNLRSMLPDPPSKALNRRDFREAEEERLELETFLQDVCEECEQLLVEAGRKYRLALSMDRTDMRALYNWGLALCYRGQLIAEEGGETAAQDADKVFLAAIDKFEAMMGLSDAYAAGALLNWGLAMRDRSRLRPLGSKERQKILAQAKEIFQEALRLDPNYGQARGAVAACTVELKRLEEYEEDPTEPKQPSTSRGFLDWWG